MGGRVEQIRSLLTDGLCQRSFKREGKHWQKIMSGWQAERRVEEKNPWHNLSQKRGTIFFTLSVLSG